MEAPWVYAVGFLAQGLFAARMLVQWIGSERAQKVVNPTMFWMLSLVASLLYFIYGWLRADFVIMLGQIVGYCVYVWNLGVKGVWKRTGSMRIPLLALLVAVPVAVLCVILAHAPEVAERLFHNDAIPGALLALGLAGQTIFSLRFVYQAAYSARRGESLLPPGFWIISLTGAVLLLAYGILRSDPVIVVAQVFGIVTYFRNLVLWKRSALS